jgi:hypothetical protein
MRLPGSRLQKWHGPPAARWCRRGNRRGQAGVYTLRKKMRSLLKPMLMSLKENPAGLIVDLGILAMFLVLLAVR